MSMEIIRVAREMQVALKQMLAPSDDLKPTVYAPIVAQARRALAKANEVLGEVT